MNKEITDKKIMEVARDARVFSKINTESALTKTRDKLEISSRETKVRTLPIRSFLGIAASILIAASIGTALYLYSTAIQWQEVSASDAVKEYKLPDGSVITLNRGSVLSYALNVKDQRLIKLEGEAFFNVQRDETKPFIISAGKAKVEVLGTSFNVNSRVDEVSVSVASGTVRLGDRGGEEAVILEQDESASFNNTTGTIETLPMDPNYLSWKTRIYSFKETPVMDALKLLARDFNKTLEFDQNITTGCVITSDFHQPDWEDIVEEFRLLHSLEFVESDNKIAVKGGKVCE